MSRLLCGEQRRREVIEPLVADWDRELRDSASRSAFARAGILVRGALALSLTLALCSLRHAFSPEGGMLKYCVVTFVLAAGLSTVFEATMLYYSMQPDYPADLLLIAAMRFSRATALATAMLPALFLLRRDRRAGLATAAGTIALGAFVVALGVMSQGWLDNYTPSAAQNERMYQRMRANDLSGRVRYPGTAVRELRDATSTPEQRKVRYEQFLVSRAQQKAKVSQPTPWQYLRRSNTTVLAVLFGVIGWMLSAIRRPTLPRAFAAWALAWLVTIVADGRLSTALGIPGPRLSWWTMPSLLAVAALALALANTRHRSTGTMAPAPLGTIRHPRHS
jgi:hypothetical protein